MAVEVWKTYINIFIAIFFQSSLSVKLRILTYNLYFSGTLVSFLFFYRKYDCSVSKRIVAE